MSDFGLYVNKPDGKTLIDGKYRNFAVWQTGVAQIKHRAALDIDPDCPEPCLLGIVPGSTYYRQVQIIAYSTGTGLSYYAYVTANGTPSPAEYNNYAVMSASPGINQENYGLKIWTPDGELAFSSFDNYMKLVGYYSVSLANNTTVVNQTVVDTDNYFVLNPFNTHMYSYWWAPDSKYLTETHTVGFKKTSATNIAMKRYLYTTWSVTAPGGNYNEDVWTTNCKLLEFKLATS